MNPSYRSRGDLYWNQYYQLANSASLNPAATVRYTSPQFKYLKPDPVERLILRKISEGEGAVFKAHYINGGNGRYCLFRPGPTAQWVDLTWILAEGSYRDAKSHHHFVEEGETLLHEVLKQDPHNAEAWNIYLAEYWRFSFAAFGRWFGPSRLSRSQRQTIKEAAENCPEDECIQRWFEVLQSDRPDLGLPAVREAIKRNALFKLEYPEIEGGFY